MRELRKQIVAGELIAVGFSPPRCAKSHRLLTIAGLNNDGLKKFICALDEQHELFRKEALNANARQSDQPIDVMRKNRA
jgi:hypothetical protein